MLLELSIILEHNTSNAKSHISDLEKIFWIRRGRFSRTDPFKVYLSLHKFTLIYISTVCAGKHNVKSISASPIIRWNESFLWVAQAWKLVEFSNSNTSKLEDEDTQVENDQAIDLAWKRLTNSSLPFKFFVRSYISLLSFTHIQQWCSASIFLKARVNKTTPIVSECIRITSLHLFRDRAFNGPFSLSLLLGWKFHCYGRIFRYQVRGVRIRSSSARCSHQSTWAFAFISVCATSLLHIFYIVGERMVDNLYWMCLFIHAKTNMILQTFLSFRYLST